MGSPRDRVSLALAVPSSLNFTRSRLTSVLGSSPYNTLKRNIFTSEIGVQTDIILPEVSSTFLHPKTHTNNTEERSSEEVEELDAGDLGAILKWSQIYDVNLSTSEKCQENVERLSY